MDHNITFDDAVEGFRIAAIKYYEQNILVSGKTNTGKSSTVYLGVAVHYISHNNNGEILQQVSQSNTQSNFNVKSNICGFHDEVVQDDFRAFLFIMNYKTDTCRENVRTMRFMLPTLNIITLTGSLNWGILKNSIMKADVILIKWDQLFHFHNVMRSTKFKNLRFFTMDECITMTSDHQIASIEIFMKEHFYCHLIQMIMVSCSFSNDKIAALRKIIGTDYARIDLTRCLTVSRISPPQRLENLYKPFRG
uniref:Helicase ATP-binding domain-containing protein n=1 Tax=Strongyloides papillosus TaxID=174720 RepID=A0A0N5CBF7_STREA